MIRKFSIVALISLISHTHVMNLSEAIYAILHHGRYEEVVDLVETHKIPNTTLTEAYIRDPERAWNALFAWISDDPTTGNTYARGGPAGTTFILGSNGEVRWERGDTTFKYTGSPLMVKNYGNPPAVLVQPEGLGKAQGVPKGFVTLSMHSPWDQNVRSLLVALMKAIPIISNYTMAASMTMGAGSPFKHKLTVGQYLRSKVGTEKSTQRIPKLWHGTSTVFSGKLERFGLRPRGDTGSSPSYGASASKPSQSDLVYLSAWRGVAEEAARQASMEHGGDPVIYVVKVPDPARLEADEDAASRGHETWQNSLSKFGTVAYRGRIPANFLRRTKY